MTDSNEKSECGSEGERLEHAKADLEKAEAELKRAEHDIERAEAEVEEAIREEECPEVFNVEVLYDGVKKPFEVRLTEIVKTLLDKAIAAFGPITNSHLLSLYKDGKPLPDADTIKQAGVKPCDVLLLRPNEVKGGV